MKLGLGTVQFGLDYGISNTEGRTPEQEAARIIEAAARGGIEVIDTAALYGASEEVLGRLLPAGHRFRIVTKTPRFTGAGDPGNLLTVSFQRSLEKLRQPRVYGLLVHNADDLLSDQGLVLMEEMLELKHRGLVEKIGVSVYTSGQIDAVLARFRIDLVQLPLNVLDQRLIASGHLARLKQSGIEIHARSAFLQGLLLMDPAGLSDYFAPVRGHLKRYHASVQRRGLSPLQAALGFVCGIPEVNAVIVGVNYRSQLEEIVANMRELPSSDFADFMVSDPAIVDPSRWPVDVGRKAS